MDPHGLTPATAAKKSAGRAHGPECAQAAQRVPRRGLARREREQRRGPPHRARARGRGGPVVSCAEPRAAQDNGADACIGEDLVVRVGPVVGRGGGRIFRGVLLDEPITDAREDRHSPGVEDDGGDSARGGEEARLGVVVARAVPQSALLALVGAIPGGVAHLAAAVADAVIDSRALASREIAARAAA